MKEDDTMADDLARVLNYENMITDNLLSYPITKLIDMSVQRDGIDTNNPKRRLIAFGSSTFLSTVVGSAQRDSSYFSNIDRACSYRHCL